MTQSAFAESVRSAATELQAATSTIIRKYNALDPRSKNALRLRVAITRLRLEISHLSEADWRDDWETYGLIEDMLSAVYDIGRSYRALDTEYWFEATAEFWAQEDVHRITMQSLEGESPRQEFFEFHGMLETGADNWLTAADIKSLHELAEST
jgi:hypothetical protein